MPNPLTLSYGEYVFDTLPQIAINSELDEQRGLRIESWRISGKLHAADQASLHEAIATLREALSESGVTLSLKSGDSTLVALDATTALEGPALASLKFTPLSDREFKASQLFEFEMRASFPLDNESAATLTMLDVERISHAGELEQVRWQGAGLKLSTTSEDAAIEAILPSLASGYRRVDQRVRFRAMGEVRFEVLDQLSAQALPAGVSDGHYVRTRSTNAEGAQIDSLAGYFIGEQAESRARALRPARARLLSESLSFNPFIQRADFHFESLAKASRDASGNTQHATLIEHITHSEKRRVVSFPLLGRTTRYKQEAGAPEYRIVQEGRATRLGSPAPPEPPLYPSDLIEREVRYETSRKSGALETHWRYVFAPTRSNFPRLR